MSFPLLDVAPPGAFSFLPLMLILLLAFVAIGVAVFLIRHRRRGKE